jgi:hypothetical protein
MAQETNEGLAYLRALQRPPASPVAIATARPWETRAPEPSSPAISVGYGTTERYLGAEKRSSTRHKCEGSAQIQEDGREVRTWATFSDVSLHGCYVEAQATYPVGTTLHLKLEANGIRVECQATVRVTYPYLAMGIAFGEMSHENREQLKELIETISRPQLILDRAILDPTILDPTILDPITTEPGLVTSRTASGPTDGALVIPDPAAVVWSLLAFFENRHMLTREDFLELISKTQLTRPRS